MFGRRYGNGYEIQVGGRRVKVQQGLRVMFVVLVPKEPMAQDQF
jgi:hypothetical protein